jgi:hypothetical protein
MENKHKGAYSELTACAWLLRQGYEVFRNISQHGRADVIAIKNNERLYIDVKSDRPNEQGYYRRTAPPPGIAYLLVDPDGACKFLTPTSFNVFPLTHLSSLAFDAPATSLELLSQPDVWIFRLKLFLSQDFRNGNTG